MIRTAAWLSLTVTLAACGAIEFVSPPGDPPPGDPPPGAISCPLPQVTAASMPLGPTATQAVVSSTTVNWEAPRVTGEVMIIGNGDLRAQNLAALTGVRTEQLSDHVTRAQTPAGETDEAFAARLRAGGLNVSPNYLYHPLQAPVPNDPGYYARSGINVTNGTGTFKQDYLLRISAKAGWDHLYETGRVNAMCGVVTAVVDAGVELSHPDLQGRLLPNGYDFCSKLTRTDKPDGTVSYECVGEDAIADDVTGLDAGHGTASAGIIGAATNNNRGIAGLTWAARNILPVKVFGVTEDGQVALATTASVIRGINYAVNQGARVVNLSLGFRSATDDPALSTAIGNATDRGVVLVAAAGNVRLDGVLYPASDPRVISVAALGPEANLACYSAVPRPDQAPIDLTAPGGTGPCSPPGDDILSLGPNGGYRLWTGSSVAAPQVSGAASLLLGLRPDLTPAQVRDILIRSAVRVGSYSDTTGTRTDLPVRLLNVGKMITEATALP